MKSSWIRAYLGATVLLPLIFSTGCGRSTPPAADAPGAQTGSPRGHATSLSRDDVLFKDRLEADGQAVVGEQVVLWIPRGAFAPEEATKLLDEYQRGIAAAKKKIGREGWNHRGDGRIYFYLPEEQFLSHASDGNCAFLPLWRVKQRQAPWLHEALHLLLDNRRMPPWLHEGLADALAIDVSLAEGLEYFSPLIEAPPDQLDELAARALREAPSPEVLAAIGGRGRPQELFGPQRRKFAVPFYSGSASFVRFIAKRHGYPPLLAAIEEFGQENEALERQTGEPLAAMKAAWLEEIGY